MRICFSNFPLTSRPDPVLLFMNKFEFRMTNLTLFRYDFGNAAFIQIKSLNKVFILLADNLLHAGPVEIIFK